jgi:hypothetical protein
VASPSFLPYWYSLHSPFPLLSALWLRVRVRGACGVIRRVRGLVCVQASASAQATLHRLMLRHAHISDTRLFHRVTGSTGSECPAPVPVPGTGRYRPVMIFVLAPNTDWPICPGRLLIGFGQRQIAARAACGAISSVLRWQRDGPWPPDGKRTWAVPVA